MNVPEVFFVNPNNLVAHPLLASIPMLDDGSPEFQSMLTSIRDRGVDYPIILDEDDRILDGRNRARAAARAGAECPAMKRSSAEASEIILASLVLRRHLPKQAQAYLAAPLLQKATDSGRQRRLANLRKPLSASISAPAEIGKTAGQLAQEMGFSDELVRQAVRVRELFENTKPRTWHDGSREVPATFKAWFEPKILAGQINLGGVIQAIAGKEATDGLTPKKRDLFTLLRRGIDDLKNRFSRWESLSVPQRREFARDMAREAADWPEDVRQEVLAGLEKAAAHPSKKPGF